jgi:hypothetical protein
MNLYLFVTIGVYFSYDLLRSNVNELLFLSYFGCCKKNTTMLRTLFVHVATIHEYCMKHGALLRREFSILKLDGYFFSVASNVFDVALVKF